MYAIIKAGGKQYTVKPGDVLRLEKLEAELGSELKLDVLMIGGEKTYVGDSAVKGAVTVVVTNQQRGPKVIVFKKKRRQGYRRMGGHRQPYTEVFVKSITSPEGQTVNAEGKPQVYNPEKKAAQQAKTLEVRAAHKQNSHKNKVAGEAIPEKKAKGATGKKKVAKKASAKSGAKKKKSPAKKAAGKKTAAKKTTKK